MQIRGKVCLKSVDLGYIDNSTTLALAQNFNFSFSFF